MSTFFFSPLLASKSKKWHDFLSFLFFWSFPSLSPFSKPSVSVLPWFTIVRALTADVPNVSNAKYLAIWHIWHTKHKKHLPSDVVYVSKLYHLCPYYCKFVTVRTQMLNQNIVFYSAFSLLWLLVLIFSLSSHIRPSSSFNRERTKWYTPHLQTISSKARWPLSSEAQAAWVRPLQSSPSSSPLWSRWSLSFFWWLVVLIVGGWLILVDGGRLIGLWVVGVRLGWWLVSPAPPSILVVVVDVVNFFFFGVGADIGCSVCLSFFFFLGSSGWYWWSVVDLWGWPMVVGCGSWSAVWVVNDNGGGDNILF